MIFSETRSYFAVDDLVQEETLKLLDWHELCNQISTFASTNKGRENIKKLDLPDSLSDSRKLLSETLEILELDESSEHEITFQGIYDLDDILKRSNKGSILSGEELLKIASTLSSSRRIRRQVNDENLRPVCSKFLKSLLTLPDLEKTLKNGLDEGGRISDHASQMLKELRLSLFDKRQKRIRCLQELIRRFPSAVQDKAIYERNSKPVLALKLGVLEQIPGIVHGTSSSGNTVFLEPNIAINLGNQISSVELEIHKEEKRLLKNWSNLVTTNYFQINQLYQNIIHLDLAFARARYGKFLQGVSPIIEENENSPFIFEEFRHPLLIWKNIKENAKRVVPISIEVSADLKVVAITGPNTGGKTVTLKSIGLAALMARAGLLLPCKNHPRLPWCRHVYADIGDEQSLQQSLSTFSGHVKRITRIIQAISNNTGPALILLDEIGAGTDPTEGTALAIALLKTLADRARLTIATTHFGELKALKYSDKRFENASVAFDIETIMPTYKLQWGIPGQSNALIIAQKLGLDCEVTTMAKDLMAPQGLTEVNQVIKGLEEQRNRQQEAAEDAAALLARTELLHEELLAEWKQQTENSKAIREEGRQKLENSIREGQKEVRELIKRLRHEDADGETARLVGRKLRRMENELQSKPQNISNDGWLPKLGDQVRLIALGKVGEVVEISEDGFTLTVLCGLFRSKVRLNDVENLQGERPLLKKSLVKVNSNFSSKNSLVRISRNTLDVRGLRVHEAEIIIEDRLRNGESPLWVIHGIGTGRLKKGLLDWLNTLSYVSRVVDAEKQDGGAGCSVIWLD